MSLTMAIALAALAAALATQAELLQRLRLVDERAPPWWFGYARDGASLAANLMLWGGYLMAGFPSPVALAAAMLTALTLYLVDWTFARALGLKRVRLALAPAIAGWLVAVALAGPRLSGALGRLVAAVQPR
jgi:hypothetical protein